MNKAISEQFKERLRAIAPHCGFKVEHSIFGTKRYVIVGINQYAYNEESEDKIFDRIKKDLNIKNSPKQNMDMPTSSK